MVERESIYKYFIENLSKDVVLTPFTIGDKIVTSTKNKITEVILRLFL